MGKIIVAIPDMHVPFHDKKSLERAYRFIEKLPKVDVVVQMGDLADWYSQSKFPRKIEVISPKKEFDQARVDAEKFWQRIKKIAPKASCYQLWGNHETRGIRKILEKAPDMHHMVEQKIGEFLTFPGVSTQKDFREELFVEGICFMHDFYNAIGQHMRFNLCNTVRAHNHRLGVVYMRNKGKTIWELSAGHIANLSSVPLSYTSQKIIHNQHCGLGLIDTSVGPMAVPL